MSHLVQPRHRGARALANRQGPPAPSTTAGNGDDDDDNDNGGGGNGGGGNGGGGNGGGTTTTISTTVTTPTTTSTSPTPPPPAATPTTTSTSSSPPSTSSTPSPSVTPTQATPSATPSSASLASSSSTVASAPVEPSLVTSTAQAVTIQPSVQRSVSRTLTSAAETVSASETAAPSGGISTGAIAGGVVGGIAGLIFLVVLVGFVLRRMRRNRAGSDFDASQFRRSAVLMDDDKSEFFSARPPTMLEAHTRSHGAAPSISSSINVNNMAGMGSGVQYEHDPYAAQPQAYAAQPQQYPATQQQQQYPTADGGYMTMERETSANVAPAAVFSAAPGQIREREKYTFGEAPANPQRSTDGHTAYGSGSQPGHYDDNQSQYQFYADQAGSQYDAGPSSSQQQQQYHQPARPSVGEASPYGGI